jgi:septal ring factor EnvC (AmiA/AmiB activator)
MLAAAASEQGEGGFDAAKKVVKDLITTLEEQAAEESEKKKYCEAELAKKSGEKTDVEDTLKSLEAAIDYKATEVESLENKIKSAEESVYKMKDNLEEAQKVRKEEEALYVASSKDRTLAVKVLKQAKAVLNQFYETQDNSASLAQLHGKQDPACNCTAAYQPVCGADGVTYASSCKAACKSVEVAKEGECEKVALNSTMDRPETFTHSSRKDVASEGVLDLMDMIAEEIKKEQDEADSQEKEAFGAFATLSQETRENEDHLWQEITEWVKLKAKLAVRLNIDKETKTQRTDNLESVEAQIASLKDECDDLLEHFDQRVKARNFEVAQMKDVMDILAGSSAAPRTGFIQQGEAQMSKRELALLKGLTSEAA